MIDPCPCETTVKEGSPGLISDTEDVARIIFQPEEWNGDQFLEAVSIKALKRSNYSVVRPTHTTLAIVQEYVVEKRSNQQLVGVALAKAEAVRSIVDNVNKKRLFCVFDSPVFPGFLGHGMMGFSQNTKADKFFGPKNTKATAALKLVELYETSGFPKPLKDCFVSVSRQEGLIQKIKLLFGRLFRRNSVSR